MRTKLLSAASPIGAVAIVSGVVGLVAFGWLAMRQEPVEGQQIYADHQAPSGDEIDCRGERLTYAALADRRGLSEEQARTLRGDGFTAQTLCGAQDAIIATAVRKLTRAKPDSPGEWLEWRNQTLRDENGVIDPQGLMRAKAHVDRMREAQPLGPAAAGITPGSWVSRGPGNIGGRVRALVIHPTSPDTMIVGSVAGGMWRTTNGGTSWTPLDDFMANLAVSTIVMQPGAPATLYAGTGEGYFNADGIRGAGIFKSSDGGTTWGQLASTSSSPGAGMTAFDFQYVNRLAMSPDGSVLLAATRTGIFRSTDGGTSFARTTLTTGGAISTGNGITDIDFHPTDGSLAIAATFAGTALYSLDGGATWSLASGLPGGGTFRRVETAYAPSDGQLVYASVDADSGSLYASANGGQSYIEVFDGATDTLNPLAGQGWYDNLLWVSPSDPNLVVWGGIDLFRSSTGGVSFSRMSQWFNHSFTNPTSAHADQHIAVAHPGYDGISNRTVFFGNDGGIYRATDVTTVGGGSTPYRTGWSELNNGLAITQLYGAAGHPGSGRITAGTQDNGTLFYDPTRSDASESWTAPFGGDGGFSAYDSANSSYFYGEYVYATVHRNSSGGTFGSSYIYTGLSDANSSATADFIAALILDPNDNDRLLVGAARLWRSNNPKAATPSWEVIKNAASGNVSAIAIAPGNSSIVYAGHGTGHLYKTIAGTEPAATVQSSWTPLDNNDTSNPLPNRRITRITIDPVNSDIVYVTFGGFSGNNVYQSIDGGASWTDISGPSGGVNALPDVPVRDLEIHPTNSDWIYAATEVGIFASENGGATWSLPQDGPANVSVDELFFLGTTLYAATHGRGLFSAATQTTLPTLSIDDVIMIEGSSSSTTATFTVTLSAPSSSSVAVNYATADDTATIAGGDYAASSGTLTFAPGITTRTIAITIGTDSVFEIAERFTVSLSGASAAVIVDDQGVGTIRNDDFTDLSLGAFPIRAVHITELRTTINEVRATRGLAAFVFTDPTLAPQSTVIKAVHVIELRTALDAAYAAAGLASPVYTDPTITPGVTTAKTAHMLELRAAAVSLP